MMRSSRQGAIPSDLGYLTPGETLYRRSAGTFGLAWLLGQQWRQAFKEGHLGHRDYKPYVDWDHERALLPGGGRRVLLNQPYQSLSRHLRQAQAFAAANGLDAWPVAEADRGTSAVLFVRSGVEVSDVVVTLRAQWLKFVPDATAPR